MCVENIVQSSDNIRKRRFGEHSLSTIHRFLKHEECRCRFVTKEYYYNNITKYQSEFTWGK